MRTLPHRNRQLGKEENVGSNARVEHVVTAVLVEVQGQKQQLGAKGMGQRRLHGRLELTPSSRGCDSEEGVRLCVTTQQRGCGAGQGRAAGA